MLIALLLGLGIIATSTSKAAAAIEVRKTILVNGPIVTLADLFSHIDERGAKAVFRAPDPGKTGTVSVSRIIAVGRKNGIHDIAMPSFAAVSVTRSSRKIEIDDLKALIRARLDRGRKSASDTSELEIALKSKSEVLHFPSHLKDPLDLVTFNWSRQSGKFTAIIGLGDANRFTIKGSARFMTEITVPKHTIPAGTLISADDLETKRLAATRLRRRDAARFEDVVGKSPVRRLRTGSPIYQRDLEAPKVIRRNQIVTILLKAPGLMLRAEGKALADAATGEAVKIMNTQSKRIIHATVEGPGLVTVRLGRTASSGS
jgi:flagella basal body P-ring formation protein FlgA